MSLHHNRTTKLLYDDTERLWLRDNGFELLHDFLHHCCEEIYQISSRIPLQLDGKSAYFNVATFERFHLQDTASYPPDGTHGVYYCPHDFVPSPWGNLASNPNSSFLRNFLVCEGVIEHQTQRPETFLHINPPSARRQSAFRQLWGMELDQVYENGIATERFTYSNSSFGIGLPGDGGPNFVGLFRKLGLSAILESDLRKTDAYQNFLFENDWPTINYQLWRTQKWDASTGRWRGFVEASFRTGMFRSESKLCFLE